MSRGLGSKKGMCNGFAAAKRQSHRENSLRNSKKTKSRYLLNTLQVRGFAMLNLDARHGKV